MLRLDRLAAILTQLQSKRTVRAAEIADRFGVSLRTIYRDIASLQEAGVPVVGEAGIGYSLAEGYRLAPVHFDQSEAAAFLAAEKLVEKMGGPSLAVAFGSGLLKIRAVLRPSEKTAIERLDSAIEVRAAAGKRPPDGPLQAVLAAIASKTALRIEYAGRRDEGMARARLVEPVGVFYQNDAWRMIAFCRLREGLREFRLDRIGSARATSDPFRGDFGPLKAHLEQLRPIAAAAERKRAEIEVENAVLPHIETQKAAYGFVSQQPSETHERHTVLVFEAPNYEFLGRWAMQFSDQIAAAEPPELAELLRSLARKAIERLG